MCPPPAAVGMGQAAMRAASQTSQRWSAALIGRSSSRPETIRRSMACSAKKTAFMSANVSAFSGQVEEAHADGALAHAAVGHAGEAVERLVVPQPVAAHLAHRPEGPRLERAAGGGVQHVDGDVRAWRLRQEPAQVSRVSARRTKSMILPLLSLRETGGRVRSAWRSNSP